MRIFPTCTSTSSKVRLCPKTMHAYSALVIIGLVSIHAEVVSCLLQPKLLSKHNQCGKWNVLAGLILFLPRSY